MGGLRNTQIDELTIKSQNTNGTETTSQRMTRGVGKCRPGRGFTGTTKWIASFVPADGLPREATPLLDCLIRLLGDFAIALEPLVIELARFVGDDEGKDTNDDEEFGVDVGLSGSGNAVGWWRVETIVADLVQEKRGERERKKEMAISCVCNSGITSVRIGSDLVKTDK